MSDLHDPTGSTAPLTGQLCFALYAANRAMAALYRPSLAPLGLTYTQYLAMLVLWEQPTATIGELGEYLHLDSGTLSPVLKRLEQAGLVSRRRSVEDERVVEVSVTAGGVGLRERAAGVPAAIARATGMTAGEIAALRNVLQMLTMRLRAADPPAASRSAGVAGDTK